MVIGTLIRFFSTLFINPQIAALLHQQPPPPPPPEDIDFFMIGPMDGIDEEPLPAPPPQNPSPPPPPQNPSLPPPPLRNIDQNEIERMRLLGYMAERNTQLTDLLVIPQMVPSNIDYYVDLALDFWNPEQHSRRIHRLLAFSAREGPFKRIGHDQDIQNSYMFRTPIVRLQGSADRVFSVVMFDYSKTNDTLDHTLQFMIVNIHATQNDMPMDIVEQQVVFPLVRAYPGPPIRYMLAVAYEQRTLFNINDLRRRCIRSTFDPKEFARTHHLRPAGALTFKVDREIMGMWAGRYYIVEGHPYN